ncbi:MAG: response regulator transcription factor [bacterium]
MRDTKSKIKIFLIEDNKILREGMVALLKSYDDIQVVAASANCNNTILTINEEKPNVVLLDIGLRSHSSLRAVDTIRKKFSHIKIVIIHLIPVPADILKFIKAGSNGFVIKDATLDELIKTIRLVSAGEMVLPDNLTDSLFSHIIDNALKCGKTSIRDSVKLSKPEKQIIQLISDGLTNSRIAFKLKISTFTVNCHVQNIIEKLTLRSRLDLPALK